jgi:AsmA-like C-terminal region
MLGLPEDARRRPLLAVKTFADLLGSGRHWPLPVTLRMEVENVNFAGETLQRVRGEVRLNGVVKEDGNALELGRLDFRAPGATQLSLKDGRLSVGAKGLAFAGRAKIEARDPRGLVAWLSEGADAQKITATALTAEGDITLGSETIAIEGLNAEVDRMPLQGRFAYSWARGESPPRVAATLKAREIDLDRLQALTLAIFPDTVFDRPGEGKLELQVERASFWGIEARGSDVNLQFSRDGIRIEKLTIEDFGGARIEANGELDRGATPPRGKITLDLNARSLDGIAAILERLAPQQAAELRSRAARLLPARLTASLEVNANQPRVATLVPANTPTTAQFTIKGPVGPLTINLTGRLDGFGESITFEELGRLAAAKVALNAAFDSKDSTVLAEILGLDSVVAVEKTAGSLNLEASGLLNGDLALKSRINGGGLSLSADGTLRLTGDSGPAANLALNVVNANLRSPRPPLAGRGPETLPVSFNGRLALADGTFRLSNLNGKVAGTTFGGNIQVGTAQPAAVAGEVEIGAINLPAVLAASTGSPAAANAAAWANEPFGQGLLGRLSGQIVVKSDRVSVTPKLAARAARGVLRLEKSKLTLAEMTGTLAGGQVQGEIAFLSSLDGMTARGHVQVANADLAELLPGDGRGPISGRVTLNVDMEGTGRSPGALVGALHGSGTFALQDGQILRLDPGTFAAVIHSVELGLPVDATRIRDRVESTLGSGRLVVPRAEGEILIAAGQARLNNAVVQATGAELALNGSLALADNMLDARATLRGPEDAGGPPGTRPEIVIALKGPLDAPKRTLDVATLANWLALRSVEQQAKKIDALESGREVPGGNPYASPPPAVAPLSPPTSAAPPATAARPRPSADIQRRATAAKRNPPEQQPQQQQPSLFNFPFDLRPPMQILRMPNGR